MTTTDVPDYYAEFGIGAGDSAEEIGRKLDREHRSWAGKASKAPTADKRRAAEDKVRRVLEARRALTDPSARALYDRRLARSRTKGPGPLDPESGRPAPGGTVRDWVGIAERNIEDGDLQAAEYELRQAVHHDDRNAYAWGLLGVVHQDLGAYQDALHEHRRALELEPDDAASHFRIGTVHTALGDHHTALTWYLTAAELAPGDLETELAIGDGLYASSRFDDALTWYEKALAHSPRHPGLRDQISRIWSLRAESAMITHPASRRLVVASEEDARRILHCVDQGLAVRPADPDLVGRLEFYRGLARESLGKTWRWHKAMAWVVVPAAIAVFLPIGTAYTLLVAAAAVALVVWIGFKPRWWHTRASLPRHLLNSPQQSWSRA
ncbi:tetratricopeptide repeat protein [Streptomyces sp. NPDC026673]|uniref:tetratricopeptide repeat protein n=1 Tax=Streptomyces sp. NPDC026673 TaxID=3155724 RepID=UPI00340CE0A9